MLCPSYGDNLGSLTLALYAWTGRKGTKGYVGAFSQKVFTDFSDNSYLTLSFPALTPGEYLLEASSGKGGVGVYKYSETKTGTYLYDNGLETDGVFDMKVSYLSTPAQKYSACQSVAVQREIKVPEKSDDFAGYVDPSSWAAIDGLKRKVPLSEETGEIKKNKTVGLFYWTWHSLFSFQEPANLSEIMEEHPEAKNDYSSSVWTPYANSAFFWNRPVYGYYDGRDRWVIRKQAELLADAGVDVIFIDNSNADLTYRNGLMILLDAFEEARRDGVKTPQISFVFPFADLSDTKKQLRELYLSFYRENLYQDLWFYWENKPLLVGDSSCLDAQDYLEEEILSFFTFRKGEARYDSEKVIDDNRWTWLSNYPQAVTYKNGAPEEMTVGTAQNYSSEKGLTAMNGENVYGRTYTSNGYDDSEDAVCKGANFAEQADYALKVDPSLVFITGWNEWIAGRREEWEGVANAFPDEFDDEYSRDLEPSSGKLKDNYYYQLVSFIRKFKGASPLSPLAQAKTISQSDFSGQFEDVKTSFSSYKNSTKNRDHKGYGSEKYSDSSLQNDIVLSKVSYDNSNLYFYVKCKSDLSQYQSGESNWMNLFIRNPSSDDFGWEGFQYRAVPEGQQKCSLYKSLGGWSWEKKASCSYSVSSSSLMIIVPKGSMDFVSGTEELDFKWIDNALSSGDIMDVYTKGEAAPGGRFAYRCQLGF